MGQLGKIFDDFRWRHTVGQPIQYVINRDPQAPDTGLPAAFIRVYRDNIIVFHGVAFSPIRDYKAIA